MTVGLRTRLRWSAAGIGLIVLAVGFSVWAAREPEAENVASVQEAQVPGVLEQAATRVEAVRVRRGDLPMRAEATGYLEPWRKIVVKAETSGRVVSRAVEEGGRVEAGSLMVMLDERERRIELEEAQADWLKSQAAFAVSYDGSGTWSRSSAKNPGTAAESEAEVGRLEKLVRDGLLPLRDLIEAKRQLEARRLLSGERRSEVQAASSGLTQAEQRLERSRLALERTRVTAAFAGRVADLTVEVGQQVSSGDSLLTLLQDGQFKVDVDVLEADIVRIRRGAHARVRIPSAENLILKGTVQTVNPLVSAETGTGRVTVGLANPRCLLLAGLFAVVELETDRLEGRLLLPASAVLVRQGRDVVFRIEAGRAQWTYVTVGIRSGDLVEIREGVSEGDLVAIGGHFALAHEAPVEAIRPTGERQNSASRN